MTTTLETPEKSAPASSDAPVEDLAEKFYGTRKDKKAEAPAPEPPTPETETGTPSPEKEKAPAEPAKDPSPGKTDEPKEPADRHQAAAQRLGREVKDLKHELESRETDLVTMREEIRILKAKADGTYQEPKAPTAEEIRAKAIFEERERNSRIVATEQYGREAVKKGIYDDNSAYEQLVKRKPWLQLEVMRHESPTVRGMQLLALEEFTAVYGDDPSQWAAKIIAEAEPKLLEKFKTSTTKTPVGSEAPSITQARGDGGPPKHEKSLADKFYGAGTVVK